MMKQSFLSFSIKNSKRTAFALRQRRFLRRAQGGFTLVEVLVVLAIIGLIMGLAGPRVLNYLNDSKVKAAKLQMENIGSALDLYYLDAGHYPQTSEGLTALMQRPADGANWNGPYLKGATVPNDPWGRAYVYRAPGQNAAYELKSLGPEGQEGARNAISRLGETPR